MLPKLPVRELPNVGYKTERLLKELGVHTAGELCEVPRPVLDDLFGVRGAEWHKYARGIDERKVKAQRGPKTVSRETTFNADSVDLKFLEGTLYYLLERICLKLRDRLAGEFKGALLRSRHWTGILVRQSLAPTSMWPMEQAPSICRQPAPAPRGRRVAQPAPAA